MYQINNFTNNDDVKLLDSLGPFTVIEYQKDLSVMPGSAQLAYYCNAMNVRKRQVICDLSKANITLQAGAMQWMGGHVEATTGVKGIGDLFSKALKGAVTKESAVKPEYIGDGYLVLEPTYKHIILQDISSWGPVGMTIEDGMFLACDSRVKRDIVTRKNLSSAVLGGEGLFNMSLRGNGVVALESNVPEEELIEIELENDELKIDGNMAMCWSSNLDFTVERTTKTLVGSAVSGEGLVNVYRGTGRVLMSPIASTLSMQTAASSISGTIK